MLIRAVKTQSLDWNGWALGIIPGIGCETQFAIHLCTEVIWTRIPSDVGIFLRR